MICGDFPSSVDKYITDDNRKTTPETFDLARSDLDLQIIFVDNESGRIVGIIDRSGLRTVSRRATYASLSLSLRKDLEYIFKCPLDTSEYPLVSLRFNRARGAYHLYLRSD